MCSIEKPGQSPECKHYTDDSGVTLCYNPELRTETRNIVLMGLENYHKLIPLKWSSDSFHLFEVWVSEVGTNKGGMFRLKASFYHLQDMLQYADKIKENLIFGNYAMLIRTPAHDNLFYPVWVKESPGMQEVKEEILRE